MKSTTFAISAFAAVAAAVPQAPAYGGANATSSAAPTYATGNTASCEKQYDQCRSVTDPNNPPNFSACAAEYSACLGYSPFASNGTNTVTAQPTSGPDAYVTQIVTSLETYCPSPTTLTYNSKTYTVTKPTTLTITDCPCKHTVPATELPPAKTVTAVVSSFTTVCPTPTVITTKSKTYTVTSATTLTITHCPGGCTVTTPASYVCPTTTPAPKPTSYKPSGSAPPAYKPSGSAMPSGSKPPVTVTKMVSSYTTVCPSPTTFTVKGSTYSVSSSTTLTITHCPGGCPVATTVPAPKASQPAASQPAASMPSQAAPKPSASSPAQAPPAGQPAPVPSGSGRPVTQITDGQIQAPPTQAPAPSASSPVMPSGSPAMPSGTAPAQYTGAADKAMAGGSLFAAGLAAALMI